MSDITLSELLARGDGCERVYLDGDKYRALVRAAMALAMSDDGEATGIAIARAEALFALLNAGISLEATDDAE